MAEVELTGASMTPRSRSASPLNWKIRNFKNNQFDSTISTIKEFLTQNKSAYLLFRSFFALTFFKKASKIIKTKLSSNLNQFLRFNSRLTFKNIHTFNVGEAQVLLLLEVSIILEANDHIEYKEENEKYRTTQCI